MDIRKIKETLEGLRSDVINCTPVNIDWRERLGEDCEGWIAYDSDECSECGDRVVGSFGEHQHCDLDETDCEGYVNFSEPMMNYYYPLPHADLEGADVVKVSGCLVLVQFDDGEWALALSGGGMDLSWEICRAHVELGYLPPVHFRLSKMAGMEWNEENALVVMAMRKSLEIAGRWLQSKVGNLDRIEDILKDNSIKAVNG